MVKVEIEDSWVKLWVDLLRKILVQIEKANKGNSLTYQQSTVTLLISKKIKNKVKKTLASSNAIAVIRKTTIPMNT